jgi:CHAT domain-containing protein
VPDDALTFLPPDFIFNNQGTNVVAINLVSAKAMPARKGSARMGVDAFAATKGGGSFPPLPSARDEATFLSSYKFAKLSSDSVQRAFIDSNFTKSNLKESLSNPRDIVHIASHFKASGGTDKDVGLLLGDGSFLSLQDLFAGGQSYSGVSLLTLSACETGVSLANLSSQAKTFDGLAGLFAKKGVSQVLATLWKISDSSTADFMKVFYIYKESEGLNSIAALEKTKTLFSGKNTQEIQVLSAKYPDIFTAAFNSKISKYSHPFYWAGFVLVSSGT